MKTKWILWIVFEIFKFIVWSYLFVFFSLMMLYLLFWWISFSLNIWWFQFNLWNTTNNITSIEQNNNQQEKDTNKKDSIQVDMNKTNTSKFEKNSEWKYEWWHLLEYTEDNFKKALLWWDQVLLLFKANWCVTCKMLEDEIQEQWIPRWILIMYVDFDKEHELRKQYKVNNQHTVIYVDHQWNETNRDLWWDYNQILQKTL